MLHRRERFAALTVSLSPSCGQEIGGICLSLKCQGIYFYLRKNTLRPGIIIPVLEHCMGAEIVEAKGALTCMKEH